MPNRRRNAALWVGALLIVIAVLSNGLYFLLPPGEALLPWASIALPALSLLCLVLALKRAFGSPQLYRGKVLGSILTVLATLVLAFGIFSFVAAHHLPGSKDAPAVGQKLPDFSLTETGNQTITLAQLVADTDHDSPSARPPKAVLLVFYRGYW